MGIIDLIEQKGNGTLLGTITSFKPLSQIFFSPRQNKLELQTWTSRPSCSVVCAPLPPPIIYLLRSSVPIGDF